eukprot:6209757-Pleurochrysis_carterae.AAC.2
MSKLHVEGVQPDEAAAGQTKSKSAEVIDNARITGSAAPRGGGVKELGSSPSDGYAALSATRCDEYGCVGTCSEPECSFRASDNDVSLAQADRDLNASNM